MFSPKSHYLASGCSDGFIRLIILDSHPKTVGKHEGCVFALAFSPDERLIVSGSEDQTVRIWEIESLNEVRRFHHEGWVNSVAFSPDGTHVVSGSDDKFLRLWNIQTNRCVMKQSL